MIIFKTESWGGCDGHLLEKKYFLKEESARKEAKNNDWNEGYRLFKMKIKENEDGQLCVEEEVDLGKIPCGRNPNV